MLKGRVTPGGGVEAARHADSLAGADVIIIIIVAVVVEGGRGGAEQRVGGILRNGVEGGVRGGGGEGREGGGGEEADIIIAFDVDSVVVERDNRVAAGSSCLGGGFNVGR